jgi:peptide-methionine (S)-S-oxide reductase
MRKLALVLSLFAVSPAAAAPKTETAVLAGGCVWGMEWVFEHVKGVTGVVSGYAGGSA